MISLFISLLVFNASASDLVKSGTTLKEDSYVFSLEEAERLKIRIEDLEKKERLLDQYEKLDSLKKQQIDLLQLSLETKDRQISLYNDIIIEKDKQILLIQKTKRSEYINSAVIFMSGIALTSGALYAADKLDDSLEQ
jgi:hypothetical protein